MFITFKFAMLQFVLIAWFLWPFCSDRKWRHQMQYHRLLWNSIINCLVNNSKSTLRYLLSTLWVSTFFLNVAHISLKCVLVENARTIDYKPNINSTNFSSCCLTPKLVVPNSQNKGTWLKLWKPSQRDSTEKWVDTDSCQSHFWWRLANRALIDVVP